MRKKSLNRGLLHSKQKGDVAERQVANALETEQSPAFLTVGSRKGDIYTDKFHVESKYNGRKNFIIKNTDWLQEKKRAAMVGKIPLFASTNIDDVCLISMELETFKYLLSLLEK